MVENVEEKLVDVDLGGDYIRQNLATILPQWATRPPIYVPAGDTVQVVCNRYADVMEVFKDRERFSVEPPTRDPGMFDRFLGMKSLAMLDGREHDRLRRLVAPTFAPGNVQRQADIVSRVVNQLLDSVEQKGGTFDVMGDVAMHLVAQVLLSEMLKMKPDQVAAFIAAGDAIGAVSQLRPGEAVPDTIRTAFADGRHTVEALIAERRGAPGDDMISSLILARDAGDRMTDSELFDQIFIICAAALTTTAGSLGGLLLSLGRNPDQFDQVKADLTLVPAAVEEGLRFHGPGFLAFPRFATADTSVGGTAISKGTVVHCSFQAACYDPLVFPDPMRFDIHRRPKGIMIFGAGPHHCLGQTLARLILQTSLKVLVERFPKLALADPDFQPRYHGEFGEALMVELPMTTH